MSNAKQNEFLSLLAQRTGLRLNSEQGIIYGEKSGFELMMYNSESGVVAEFAAMSPSGSLSGEECKAIKKLHKGILSVSQNQNSIVVMLYRRFKQEATAESVDESLRAVTSYLSGGGFVNVCRRCGKECNTKAYNVNGTKMLLCEDCFDELSKDTALQTQIEKSRTDNLVGGIVGALIGAMLGGAAIILVSQLGYISIISGFIMGVCTLKGYQIGSGKLTRRGIAVSMVMMLLMVYLADRMDWAILVAREFEVSITEAYRAIPMLIQEDVIENSSYISNILKTYLFTILGAVPMITDTVKHQKESGKLICLQEDEEDTSADC